MLGEKKKIYTTTTKSESERWLQGYGDLDENERKRAMARETNIGTEADEIYRERDRNVENEEDILAPKVWWTG